MAWNEDGGQAPGPLPARRRIRLRSRARLKGVSRETHVSAENVGSRAPGTHRVIHRRSKSRDVPRETPVAAAISCLPVHIIHTQSDRATIWSRSLLVSRETRRARSVHHHHIPPINRLLLKPASDRLSTMQDVSAPSAKSRNLHRDAIDTPSHRLSHCPGLRLTIAPDNLHRCTTAPHASWPSLR